MHSVAILFHVAHQVTDEVSFSMCPLPASPLSALLNIHSDSSHHRPGEYFPNKRCLSPTSGERTWADMSSTIQGVGGVYLTHYTSTTPSCTYLTMPFLNTSTNS